MSKMQTNRIIESGEDGQGYLVSVSDLMAGLLFLFIITIMVFALSLKETEHKLDKKEQEKDIEVRALRANKDARNELLTELDKSLKNAGVEVVIDLEQGVLRLPEDVLFASGKATLNQNGLDNIQKLASALALVLPCYVANRSEAEYCKTNKLNHFSAKVDAVFIEGHTDDVPVSQNLWKFHDNWELSTARSIETFKQLELFGKHLIYDETDLLTLSNSKSEAIFGVSGYADQRPVLPNTDDSSRSRNRRIDLRFIMEPPDTEPEPIPKTREYLQK